MKIRPGSLIIAAILLAICTLAVIRPPMNYFPFMEAQAPENLRLTFLLNSRPTMESCEAMVGNITRVTLANCANCNIEQAQCITELNAIQQRLFSDQPYDTPSARMSGGVIAYKTANPEVALAACMATERKAASGPQAIQCFPADTPRPAALKPKPALLSLLAQPTLALLAALITSWFACWLIIRYEHLHAHLSHDQTNSGPQKFHAVPTPRIGGISLVVGLLAACGVMMIAETQQREFGLLLLASVPAFLGGLIEDITKKLGVAERLLLAMVSGAIGAWLLGGVIPKLDIPDIDQAFIWLPFAVAFTVFAVSGITNSINIIDGYNGLAGGYAIIVLSGMAWISLQAGDAFIVSASLASIGALLGFMAWNWPRGKIFLGDSGAYLIGFIIAELSVLLVVRHPEISPWFPVALLIYPIFETLFTMYRRTVLRQSSSGDPDHFHLHQLIFIRLVRKYVGSQDLLHRRVRNSSVAPYIWIANACFVVPFALLAQNSTVAQQIFCVVFAVGYIWLYSQIVNWRSPKFLMLK